MKKTNKNITISDLAAMVKNGFEETAKKADIDRLDKRLDTLEQGHEDIKLRLDNVASF